MKQLLLLSFFLQIVSANAQSLLDLSGPWRLRLDAEDAGMTAQWAAAPLTSSDTILLPNTTDRAGFGFALDTNTMLHGCAFPVTTRFPGVKEPVRADEHGYLVRRHLYVGPAWYEREINIPDSWKGRPVVFRMERVLWKTTVWVDGRSIGSCDSLVAEHRYDLGVLPPGKHRLTVCVDNRMIHNISTVTHAYGPETQSRWNGMIGAITLEALPQLSIQSMDIFPAADRRSATVRVVVRNNAARSDSSLIQANLMEKTARKSLAKSELRVDFPSGFSTNTIGITLNSPAKPWDEFKPNLYRAQITIGNSSADGDAKTVTFGFRTIERVGKNIVSNGRRLYLRGTLDCCVYPNTGHPPMTRTEWEKILRVIKDHGFNHVRFHTWCPPEAAFEAADLLGLYLEPETPAWVDDWIADTVTKPPALGRDVQTTDYIRREMLRVQAAYGNHPSFALFVIGNEFGTSKTDWGCVASLISEIKALDTRRLYSGSAARKNVQPDEFWVTHNSGASTRGVGPANTDWDFAKAVAASPVPLIAHETGQRPVFPDYPRLLPKFTGPLLPLNLEGYRRALDESGMSGQLPDFVRASARFQLTQYKAEHEGMLRTKGYAGYQLLMLNDFTGQSEALVGILDPFWESKGVVRREDVFQWNAPTVPLARFAKYTWTSDETFRARLEIAHFGPVDINSVKAMWTLTNSKGKILNQGKCDATRIPTGQVTPLGEVSVALDKFKEPTAMKLTVRCAGAENSWNLWVYPAGEDSLPPKEVLTVQTLDDRALQALRAGGKVLLLAHGMKNTHANRTGFESVYWSAGWWGSRFSSLGIHCDPSHPALAAFPNAGYSDWQWRDLCAGATTLHLEGAPKYFRPIVQPVPDFHYNTLLAHVFEARVGKGSLMVCGYDLATSLDRRPAARQFRRSLYRYLASPSFQPVQEVPEAWIEKLLAPAGLSRTGARVVKCDSEDRENGNLASNAIDGDVSTIWHTRWQPRNDPMPHELVFDLGREREIAGITYLPRQDQANGRIAEVEVYCGNNLQGWTTPVATAQLENTAQLQKANFASRQKARYLRLLIKSGFSGNPFAAIAELDVVD